MAEERIPRYEETEINAKQNIDFTKTRNSLSYNESAFYLFIKRVMDIVLSVVALVVLSPFLFAIALIIYLDDPKGNPIFVQERIGKDMKPFHFYKLRSMVVDAEAQLETLRMFNEMDGPVFKIKDDPRITRVGRFIRRWSIDELPQLINIIRGEMSIVGPRPPLPNEVAEYGAYERQRLMVKPGLTCFWQISGRNEIKSFQEWIELDIKYVYLRSVLVDIKLIFLTFKVIFTGKGAR